MTVSKSGTQESGGPEKAVSPFTTVILFIHSCGQTQLVHFNRLGIGQGTIISIWIYLDWTMQMPNQLAEMWSFFWDSHSPSGVWLVRCWGGRWYLYAMPFFTLFEVRVLLVPSRFENPITTANIPYYSCLGMKIMCPIVSNRHIIVCIFTSRMPHVIHHWLNHHDMYLCIYIYMFIEYISQSKSIPNLSKALASCIRRWAQTTLQFRQLKARREQPPPRTPVAQWREKWGWNWDI